MEIARLNPDAPDPEILARAARLLREGRLVAFPTETVYGLGANALDPSAVQRIYAAKGRPSFNPLIVHIADASLATTVASAWPARADVLAQHFWPGPLTLVLPKRDVVPDEVTAGLPTVAVRVPAHPVAHALLEAAGLPIAAPSANKSTGVSPTAAAHVAKSLGDSVDLILDGGPTTVGIESTVLDLSGETPVILRPGIISQADIEAVIGPVATAADGGGTAPRPSPGMLEKHYAPRARVVIVAAGDVGIRVEHERANVLRVGAMVIDAEIEPSISMAQMPRDVRGYAARLYDTLHALDDIGCDVIIIERVPDAPEWLAVADRLRRAAAE